MIPTKHLEAFDKWYIQNGYNDIPVVHGHALRVNWNLLPNAFQLGVYLEYLEYLGYSDYEEIVTDSGRKCSLWQNKTRQAIFSQSMPTKYTALTNLLEQIEPKK